MGFSLNLISLIGFIAATCTTLALVPQVTKAIKTGKTRDISLPMYLVFSFGLLMWVIYGFMRSDVPLFIANVISLGLSCTILYLKILRDG